MLWKRVNERLYLQLEETRQGGKGLRMNEFHSIVGQVEDLEMKKPVENTLIYCGDMVVIKEEMGEGSGEFVEMSRQMVNLIVGEIAVPK